jgi:hypothetical protein
MPKAAPSELRALREEALERDKGCRWPGCDRSIDYANPLEMAHLSHRGMGGRTSVNTLEEVVMLCRTHHDCLDGRTSLGTLRYELNAMLKATRHGGEPV